MDGSLDPENIAATLSRTLSRFGDRWDLFDIAMSI
jgi:hypothetical protein